MYVVIVGGGGGGAGGECFFFFFFFDVTKVSGVTDRTPGARHSFTHSHGRNACGLQQLFLPPVFISVE